MAHYNLGAEGSQLDIKISPEREREASAISDTPPKRHARMSRRQMVIVAALIAMVVAVVVIVSVVIATNSQGVPGNKRVKGDRRITLNDFLTSKFRSKGFSLTWISDDTFTRTENGDINKFSAADPSTSTGVVISKEDKGTSDSWVEQFSANRKYFLFTNNTKKLYRHSFHADYFVRDLATGDITQVLPVRDNSATSEQIRYCGWSSAGDAIVVVYRNDIFYSTSAADMNFTRITDDGVDKKVFNGVPDWVYEEEILSSSHALEFSTNGRYMVFGTFNATNVPFFKFPMYHAQDHQYTDIQEIAYPKAGFPNPTVVLSIIDLTDLSSIKPIVLLPPASLASGEYYYSVVAFNGDQVFVQWMNRHQNSTVCSLYTWSNAGVALTGVVSESHTTPDGWVDTIYQSPKFAKDHSYYLTLLPRTEGATGEWRHLVRVNLTLQGGTTTFLTTGEFTVQAIDCFDEDDEVVYFRSSKTSPKNRHVYSLNLKDGSAPKCITCELDGGKGKYYTPKFSAKCSWVLLSCSGPGVPSTALMKTGSAADYKTMEDNAALSTMLKEYDIPTLTEYSVKSGGFDIQVRETRPVGFSEEKKYGILFSVYGGPDTQKINSRFPGIGMEEFLITNYDMIMVELDARGAGNYGFRFMHAVYRNLGHYEVEDTLAVARHLHTLSYVDPDRIGIWGWSYGGFYSSSVLALDQKVITTAVAVAPVTDWRYYDTVYTERYMGLPTEGDNLKGYQSTSVMSRAANFKGKNFLLIHGTADDNVHFQNAVQLSAALVNADVDFRQAYYPDKDHSIRTGHIWKLLANYLSAKLASK